MRALQARPQPECYAFLWQSWHLAGTFVFPFAAALAWQSTQVPFFAIGSWNAAWSFVVIGGSAAFVWQSVHFWCSDFSGLAAFEG